MKTITITVVVGDNKSTQSALVDENGFAHIVAGYVLEGYTVQGTDPSGEGIIASKANAVHIIKLGE